MRGVDFQIYLLAVGIPKQEDQVPSVGAKASPRGELEAIPLIIETIVPHPFSSSAAEIDADGKL